MANALPRPAHPDDETTDHRPRPSFAEEADALARARADVAAGRVIPDHEVDRWLDDWVAGRPVRIPGH